MFFITRSNTVPKDGLEVPKLKTIKCIRGPYGSFFKDNHNCHQRVKQNLFRKVMYQLFIYLYNCLNMGFTTLFNNLYPREMLITSYQNILIDA